MGKLQYQTYKFNRKEWSQVLFKGGVLVIVLAYLFFDSLYAVPFLLPLLIVFARQEKELRKQKRFDKLREEFRDAILGLSAALGAGYSVENACKEALKDLRFLYGEDGYMVQELKQLINGLELNRTMESLLYEFANRSGLEEVQSFADVFVVCKRTGGNIGAIIGDCASRISEKTEIYREIHTYLSAKKFEQKIMNGMPIAILFYVRLTSPDFLEGLYGNLLGILVMSGCLLLYGGAYLLAEKILKIEV